MVSEFTDRFARKTDKPMGTPSGNHAFDAACRKHGIEHRLIQPGRPQTNGMVERFNRRLVDAFAAQPGLKSRGRRKFNNHQDRDAFIHRFVANYNLTRQKCLDHKSPIETLNNLTGLYNSGSLLPIVIPEGREIRSGSDYISHLSGIQSR